MLYLQVTAPETTEFSSIISKICILLHFAGNEHNLFLPQMNSVCSKWSIFMVILKETCEQALFLREAARDRRLTRAFSRNVDASKKVAREEGKGYSCPPPSRATILMGILMFWPSFSFMVGLDSAFSVLDLFHSSFVELFVTFDNVTHICCEIALQ